MAARRICVITGSRAEYGLLYWLMREIEGDDRLNLQTVVTGSHLSPEFGLTYETIEADGLRIDRKIEVLLSSDSAAGVCKAVGLGIIGFADALTNLNPDLVVVLGDRFEILAAVQAAFFIGIPVAHISGGEMTVGSVDDAVRHCITKMSSYHFVAAQDYRRRVIQLGENPDSVFNVGDPGLDNITRLKLLSREDFGAALELESDARFLLCTYHPVTAGIQDSCIGMSALLEALDQFTTYKILFTKPNADAGGRAIAQLVDNYAASWPGRVKVFTSLGQLRYLSAIQHCAAIIGNSSSGIVEGPAMRRPTVNIGPRQSGRLKATSVIDCDETAVAITIAIQQALSPNFARQVLTTESLYGHCDASTAIKNHLATLSIERNRSKIFHDLGE